MLSFLRRWTYLHVPAAASASRRRAPTIAMAMIQGSALKAPGGAGGEEGLGGGERGPGWGGAGGRMRGLGGGGGGREGGGGSGGDGCGGEGGGGGEGPVTGSRQHHSLFRWRIGRGLRRRMSAISQAAGGMRWCEGERLGWVGGSLQGVRRQGQACGRLVQLWKMWSGTGSV